MMPLDIGDNLIDRQSSALMLKYLAKATYRIKQREIAKRKLEISIDRLRKLSTSELNRHIDELEGDIGTALEQSKLIKTRQSEEEQVHREISRRLRSIHEKIDMYVGTQKGFSKKISKLDTEIDRKFETKKTKLKKLEEDLKKLKKIYTAAKKSKKYSKRQLLAIAKKITQLHDMVKKLKR